MKKLIIIAMALVALQGFAQEQMKQRLNREERAEKMSDLTPEEAANLQTKRMTLHLDLNDAQQKEIYAINLENATMRKNKMETFKAKRDHGSTEKPSKEERLAMQNERLDHQIAMKAKMKSILNKDQFEKWEHAHAKLKHKGDGMKKKEGTKRNAEDLRKP